MKQIVVLGAFILCAAGIVLRLAVADRMPGRRRG